MQGIKLAGLVAAIGGVWDAFTEEIPDWITVPGALLSLFYYLLHPQGLPSFLLFGLVGYLLYRYGQIGGGDVLLVLALSPFIKYPFPEFFLFFASLILSSSFYGILFTLQTRPLLVLPLPFLPLPFALLYASLLAATTDKKLFVREVRVEELRPEDILAEPVPSLNKMVLGKKDIERLREIGIKRVKIMVNLPRMGPFIFLAFILLSHPPAQVLSLLL